jgi:hypothetical protein
MVKPFRHPGGWLALWWLAILAVIALSLMPQPQLQLPRDSDKVEHVLAYFALAAGAVQLFARRRALPVVALGLLWLGVGLEWAQGAWTADRSDDPFDALADAVGVGLGMATAFTPWRHLLLTLERRLFQSS